MSANCPDCSTALNGADRCRCGWVMARVGRTATPGVDRRCLSAGCPALALAYSQLCQACDTAQRQEKSAKFCEERGLLTTEAKRDFCRSLFKRRGTQTAFEHWASSITQKTVDWLVLQAAGQPDACLERLRSVGAIDGRNKLIPVEARAVVADAYRQEKARELVKLHRELEERAVRMGNAEESRS